jgi:class 3 adenylate cyclase
MRLRIPFAAISVFGLGALVALPLAITLYLSGAASVRSTQLLLAERAERMVDAVERRLGGLLRPVEREAAEIARAVAEGRIGIGRGAEIDTYMLGVLSAAPEVASVSLAEPSGRVRRWDRAQRAPIEGTLANRPELAARLAPEALAQGAGWRAPRYARRHGGAVLLYDTPLYREGRFLALLGLIVPLSDLSLELAELAAETGVTPYALYGEHRVLAHPKLAGRQLGTVEAFEGPLPSIAQINDPVIESLHQGGASEPLGMRALRGAQAVSTTVDGERYVCIHREVTGFTGQAWSVGAYVNVARAGFASEMQRTLHAILAGLAVLALAMWAAVFGGRRLARPVRALAQAANTVRDDRLDEVAPLPASRIAEFDDANRSFNRMVEGLRERTLIRESLGRFVSEEVAKSLLSGGGRIEPTEAKATVLVCDLEDFTQLTHTLGPRRTVEFLNAYFEAVVAIVERHGGLITQFQGDAILAVFNLPVENPDHAANALRAALEVVRVTEEQAFAGVRARNRVGLYTGNVLAGAVGSRGRLSYTVHGNAVNLASRIEALNKDYGTRILLAGKTAERCPGFALRKVADAQIRGYGEPVPLYTPSRESHEEEA